VYIIIIYQNTIFLEIEVKTTLIIKYIKNSRMMIVLLIDCSPRSDIKQLVIHSVLEHIEF